MGNKMEEIVRESLADVLGFLGYKIRKGSINFDDVESLKGFIARGCGVKATVKELAEYYGQSEDNVRHVIHRNLMSPPQRKVYFDFAEFSRGSPEKRHRKTYASTDDYGNYSRSATSTHLHPRYVLRRPCNAADIDVFLYPFLSASPRLS